MPRRIKNRPEEALQRAVAEFLDRALPTEGVVWFHCPNGGARSKAEAGALKAMGVKAGIPDICVISRVNKRDRAMSLLGQPFVLWIELKAKGRTPSVAQRHWRMRLIDAGCKWTLAHSVDEVEVILRGYGVPLRASVLGNNTEQV